MRRVPCLSLADDCPTFAKIKRLERAAKTWRYDMKLISPTPDQRRQLALLADAIFPIDAWMNQKSYLPKLDTAPWRTGYELVDSIHLKAVDFIFDVLLKDPIEEVRDQQLAKRWAKLQADPPDAYSNLLDMRKWRSEHGLEKAPHFAPADSENFTVATDDKNPNRPGEHAKRPLSRGELYTETLPHFYATAKATKPENWYRFCNDLVNNNNAQSGWPNNVPSSSELILQFGRDLAIAFMSLRNTTPWQNAILVEAGEFRKKGNAYTLVELEQAREKFTAVLRLLVPKPTA
jgi:hypothetical protein